MNKLRSESEPLIAHTPIMVISDRKVKKKRFPKLRRRRRPPSEVPDQTPEEIAAQKQQAIDQSIADLFG